ncbi:hypothetical protein [Methanospirillum lacunae]|uniref:Uncharacterized protein n=1 Tax=Methanospirillum lacunae TaxID=668570 RepID=A0A2V2MN78_9EURY|nr:hypothetical protein [Methanospirillum lacunae]PWR69704.1 hypothetical protein DK846_16930 [Methanospirillum lacunae]
MRRCALVLGSLFVILASLTGAEYLGTTISTDGTILLSGSGEDANGSFASRVITVGVSELSRIITGEESGVGISVTGAGQALFSDYTTGNSVSPLTPVCVFLTRDSVTGDSRADLFTSGILEHGVYTMSRVSGSGLSGETLVNGTGLMILGSEIQGNDTTGSEGFVSGNMTIHDLVRL